MSFEGKKNLQLLCVILNKTDKLSDLLMDLEDHGITGGTILDSTGMAKLLYSEHRDLPFFGSMYMLMNDGKPMNKTILMVLDEEKVEVAKQVVRDLTDGLDNAGTGIMFTVPVLSAEGLR